MSGILKYFTLTRKSLPSPDGPLSKVVPSEGILLANKEVKEVLEGDGMVQPNGKRAETILVDPMNISPLMKRPQLAKRQLKLE